MKTMKELFEILLEHGESENDCMIVTVTKSSGSAPRGAGSRMIVLADGTSHGTIGGGSIEYEATKQALLGIQEQTSFLKDFVLRPNDAADLGMICGGQITAYFQYVSHENTVFLDQCHSLLANWDQAKQLWLLLDLTEESNWTFQYMTDTIDASLRNLTDSGYALPEEPSEYSIAGRHYYIEPLIKAGTVYIFGGGHVAQELVPVLTHLDFRCVVFDDRKEFANPELFPSACRCITGNFEQLSDLIAFHPEDYVCIMTRGHLCDYIVQKQVMQTPVSYIGIMGSRRKCETLREKLLADGFTKEEINRCKSPIGLSIGAETPAEIAVSIAGELIATRANNPL